MVPISSWSIIPVDKDPSDVMFQQMGFEQTVILTCYFMPTSDWLGIGTYSDFFPSSTKSQNFRYPVLEVISHYHSTTAFD